MDSPAVEQKLFGLEAAAKALGTISTWTLRRHLKLGSFAAVRIGKRVLLSQETVERIAHEGLPSLPSPKKPAGENDPPKGKPGSAALAKSLTARRAGQQRQRRKR